MLKNIPVELSLMLTELKEQEDLTNMRIELNDDGTCTVMIQKEVSGMSCIGIARNQCNFSHALTKALSLKL